MVTQENHDRAPVMPADNLVLGEGDDVNYTDTRIPHQ